MKKRKDHKFLFFRLSGRSSERARLEGLAPNRATKVPTSSSVDFLLRSELGIQGNASMSDPFGLVANLQQAGLSISPSVFFLGAFLTGFATCCLGLAFSRGIFAPVFFLVGFSLPFAYVRKRISERAASFAMDYPTILLATASSVKVGMTPYQALRRSIQVLPTNSLVRPEIERLLTNLDAGMRREDAVNDFAPSYSLPELDLFRAALLLSLEHGGQFAPTLHRLAVVSRDRLTLIHQAKVNTATMRMTANIVLGIVPFVLITLSSRTPNFWQTLQENSLANIMATIGAIILGASYFILRRMSDFKP